MFDIAIYIFLGIILLMLLLLTYYFPSLSKIKSQHEQDDKYTDEKGEKLSNFQGFIYTSIVLVVIAILVHTYFVVRNSPWEGHLSEWLNIAVRLMHITFGIAWIGASFYFVFLENALNRTKNVRDELAGNLWAIHGGGFYYLEKYKVAPKTVPKELHWFKYEAYFTWLSGFCLLFIVYYFNAQGFLIDPNVMKLTPAVAISIGIGSLIVGWFIYDLLCKSSLSKNGFVFALTGFVIAIGFAFFYTNVFSGRAAYIHFGALLGTIMAANVFFVIIPSQKAMVKAAKQGSDLDPALGRNAGFRSLHNNYLTLPVLFVMISNHFPSTFGYQYPWLLLAIISLGTVGVKHYLNLKEKGQFNVWVLPVSVLVLLGAAFISAPQKNLNACKPNVSIAQVYNIVQTRCISCHSAKPTDETLSAPPNGISYETPQVIARLKNEIMQRVVVTKTMPQNNKTGMTEEERNIIRCWIEQGASIK